MSAEHGARKASLSGTDCHSPGLKPERTRLGPDIISLYKVIERSMSGVCLLIASDCP